MTILGILDMSHDDFGHFRNESWRFRTFWTRVMTILVILDISHDDFGNFRMSHDDFGNFRH